MKVYLKERIGNPELFTGRKKEMAYFLNWADRIKREISMSTAILSRRKTGKTAFMQRLYNIIFHRNDGIIPFYFEIREADQWLLDFSRDFFLTFVRQYIAFGTRNTAYLSPLAMPDFGAAEEISRKEGFGFLADTVVSIRSLAREDNADLTWNAVRDTPRHIAEHYDECVVQMIDEFQFINRFIFWDKERKRRAENLAGSYLGTAEYKNAPLLVSGSWVGWLMNDLRSMLPGRFQYHYMENMPEDECTEMIFKYSLLEDIPVTEETAYVLMNLTEGSPFYISAVFRSKCPDKDLTTEAGVRRVTEFETLDREGIIRGTWLEYINSAFPRINEKYAKSIVLYLSKHRDRFVPRRELKQKLNLDMPDYELDRKMDALLLSDIIEEDRFQYRGVQDNIFDKVFRGRYSGDIDAFVTREAPGEFREMLARERKKYKQLEGKYGRYKGAFAEFMIISHLSLDALRDNDLFCSMMRNLPRDFRFAEYERVWSYHSLPMHEPEFQIDIFAVAGGDEYSLIGEVKNRKAKFSVREAESFVRKAGELMRVEDAGKAVLFVFSVSGFFKNTLEYLKKNGIAWSEDARWLGKKM